MPFVTAPKTNTLAIVSFVSSFFIGLVGIITGHIALGQIRARGEVGRGFALAGLIIGYIATAVFAILVVFAIVFASAIGAFFWAAGSGSSNSGSSNSGSSNPDSSNPDSSNSGSAPESAAPLPTGVLGAANFDAGYLEFGTGAVIVDEYVDPMCPFCAQFEKANGELLAAGVESGVITLRVHSLTFLDRLSQGTNYSSRASSALTCQATLNPDQTLEFLSALFGNQPLEETAGLSNGELADLSTGAVSIAGCVEAGAYQGWSQQNTEAALTGPIDGAEIPAVSGTPTVLVDGTLYTGSLTDTAEFSAFVAAVF
ncbi:MULTISPECIES: thioredoxin domain-containing protein [unclassified Cryobacterium]|uniref:thioredoxin domain-containing protein n=1 Tax=unclassified Cryobacterium TaxID=2649013 RepID=UPI0018C9E6F4|nr:thioredoxin domain-containing protein [Cryobacterium sp. CAN_C3]